MHKSFLLLLLYTALSTMAIAQSASPETLKQAITAAFAAQPGVFALAFKDLQTGTTLYINEHDIFHAASTMKTPVLIEAYQRVNDGRLSLTDSITIVNRFKSIADTSTYQLNPADDSEFDLYKHVGEKTTCYNLLYQMITSSSNLATNIMLDILGAAQVNDAVHRLGAHDIQVLRGVEDGKAYAKGLNNVVTAYDLALLFELLANGKVVSPAASQAMIKILLDQQFKDIIPAQLPADVKVAHKTGFFTSVHHDGGIVFLPDGRKYVLVLLSRNLKDDKAGVDALAGVSALVYHYMANK